MSTQAASSRNSPAGQPKSSASWVNYQHGVNLAEAIEPGSSKRMTWEDLIAYPGKLNGQAVSPEQALLIAATRVGPALEWAAANGILPEKTSYAQSEVHTALSSLDKHQESLAGAITNLVAPLPMRKDYFTGWQMVSPIKGHNDPNNKKYKVAAYNDKQFGEDFKGDLVNKKAAYGVVIKQLISLLPVNDRLAIEHGQVELYALKPPGTGDDLARDVVLIKAVHNGKTTAYEVNPQLGIARQRVDLEALFTGNSVIGRNKLPDGTDAKEFTVWKKPNIQGRRYGPKVDNEHPEKPNNQPFSSSIYTLKLLGEFPASPASANENTVPNTLSSKRFSDVANTVSSQLFYAKDIDLLNVAQKDETRVSPEEKEDLENYQEFSASRDNRREFLKGFVPFWQGVEAIIAGRPIEGIAKIWIDILSFMMPVDKVVGGLVKGGIRLIKPVLPEFAKLSTNFGSYTLKSGMAGVKWEGGVQGLKWAQKVPQNLAKAAEQFKLNSTPLLKAGSAVREIEFKGASYFVANKPDAGDGVHYLLRVPDPKDPSKLVSSSIVAKPDESGIWLRRGVTGGGQVMGRNGSALNMASLNTLEQMETTRQFVGIMNVKTGEIHVGPSTLLGHPGSEVEKALPKGMKYMLAGHERVEPMGDLVKVNVNGVETELTGHAAMVHLAGGNLKDYVGFSGVKRADGILRLKWNSRTLNPEHAAFKTKYHLGNPGEGRDYMLNIKYQNRVVEQFEKSGFEIIR